MANKELKKRQSAINRFVAGESPESIWSSLGRSKAWFYK